MTCLDAAFHRRALSLPFVHSSPPFGGPAVGDLSQDTSCNSGGLFRGDLPGSPLPQALRFNHFTPNPSAPSPPSPNSSLNSDEEGHDHFLDAQPSGHDTGARGPLGDPSTPDVSPNGGASVSSLLPGSLLHVSSLHVAQAGGPQVEVGDPLGDPSIQPSGANVGAVGPMSGPCFLSLSPQVFCRICDVAFTPQRGVECHSLCDICRVLPPPKRLRIAMNPHRKAGPPDDE